MALGINTSLSMLNASVGVNDSQKALADAVKKLASGKRLTSAAVDPAGMAMSGKLESRVQSLARASMGNEASVNMARVADGAADKVGNLLREAREVLVSSANQGANDLSTATASNRRLNELVDNITRISDAAQFGSKKIFSGNLSITPATNGDGGTAAFNVPKLDAANLGGGANYRGEGGAETPVTEFANLEEVKGALATGNSDKIAQALGVVEKAIGQVSELRANFGAIEADFVASANDSFSSAYAELQDANSRIGDADTARELSRVTMENIRSQVKMALMSQGKDNSQNFFQLLM